MPLLPVLPSSDDRRGRGITPTILRNAQLEPSTDGDRTPYVIVETPGKTVRATFPAGLRGVYRREGVLSGALFTVAGNTLYRVSSTWAATALGTIAGVDRVQFDTINGNILVLGGGRIYHFGASRTLVTRAGGVLVSVSGDQILLVGRSAEGLTEVTPNLSSVSAPATLAVAGNRVTTNGDGSDLWDWSAAGEPFWWPDGAFAQSARRPDPIVAQVELAGDLWHFGRSSVQIWRATGGFDEDAFDTFGGLVLEVGLVGRFAWAQIGGSIAFIGVDQTGALAAYVTRGFSAAIVPNRELEAALAKLSAEQLASVEVCAWADGTKQYAAVRLPATPIAFVYDVQAQSWREDATWAQSSWRGGMTTRANDKTVWAAFGDPRLYTVEPDAFTDGGDVIERLMTVRAPLGGPTVIHTLVIDLQARGQPLSGAGAEPVMEVCWSRDGGRTTSRMTGNVRTVAIGRQGEYRQRIKLTRLGMFDGRHGLWLELRLTDPVGFALRGVYINEDPT